MKNIIAIFLFFLLACNVEAQKTKDRDLSKQEVRGSIANPMDIVQKAINPMSGEPLSEEKGKIQKISGKVIGTEKEYGLNVPNLAQFLTHDGFTHFISSPSKSFRVGEKLTLKGYFQNTYYSSVKNIANVFYITKIIDSTAPEKTTLNPIDNISNNIESIDNTGSNISKIQAEEALAFHNKVRDNVGVAPLVWSEELSRYAQEWADYLVENGCQLEHRSSLGRQDGKDYGENLAMSSGYYSAKDGSESWYSEIKDFRNPVLNSSNWYSTGHYSQMVWRNTKEIGMGSAKCKNGFTIVVANYNPSGNYMGEKAY